MRGDCGPDVGDLERRRRGGVELVGGALPDSFVLLLAVVNLSFSATLREAGTGRNGHFWGRGLNLAKLVFQLEEMEYVWAGI